MTATAAAKPLPRAYVTFLAGDGGDGLKVVVELAEGLRELGSAYALVVAVLPAVPESRRHVLLAHGCVVREVEPVHPPDENQAHLTMDDYVTNYSKLRIWEFVEYERMVYLDAGFIIKVSDIMNIDELFETGSFLPADEEVGCLPAIFALQPSLNTAKALLGKEKAGQHLGFFFHWATSLGFFATAIAVGAALNLFPAANGFGGLGATLLLFTLAVAVAGVNLLTAGVCLTGTAAASSQTLLPFPAQPVLSRAAAFARRNISVLAVSGASGVATGIILGGAAHPILCFVCFALFLLSVSLAVAGVASGSG